MSYDISIGNESLNYTSNVSALFYDHIPDLGGGGGLGELHGLTGKQAAAVLGEAFEHIHSTFSKDWRDGDVGAPQFCARYDSKNGWGSATGGLIFLARIMAACQSSPRKKVGVWA